MELKMEQGMKKNHNCKMEQLGITKQAKTFQHRKKRCLGGRKVPQIMTGLDNTINDCFFTLL